VKDVRLYPRG